MNDPSSQREEMDILELLNLLEEGTPMVPDSLMEFYMNKAGVQCEDVRLYTIFKITNHPVKKLITDGNSN